MRDPEQTIERLLTGLREAEPPVGMKRRILDATETRAGAVSLSPWGTHVRLACAVVVAALCIVTGTVSWRPREPDKHPNQHLNKPQLPQTIALEETPRLPRRVRAQKRVHPPHLQVAGYPAPPLPLTEQEKLLLRLAHRRDRAVTAILNDNLQAAQTAKATEQFQQFFGMNAKEMRSQIE